MNSITIQHYANQYSFADGYIFEIGKTDECDKFIILKNHFGLIKCIFINNEILNNFNLIIGEFVRLIGFVKKIQNTKGDLFIIDASNIFHMPQIMNMNEIHNIVNDCNIEDRDKLKILTLEAIRNHYKHTNCIEIFLYRNIQSNNKDNYISNSQHQYINSSIGPSKNVYCVVQKIQTKKINNQSIQLFNTYIEAEYLNIDFTEFSKIIECLTVEICSYLTKNMDNLCKNTYIKKNNILNCEIRQMTYKEAIDYCNSNRVYKTFATKIGFKYGDIIHDSAKLQMVNKINKFIVLTKFPEDQSHIFAKKCHKLDDNILIHTDRIFPYKYISVTESVELLLPNIGSVLNGLSHITNLKELLNMFKYRNIDKENYSQYINQIKYNTGGRSRYCVNIDKLIIWLMNTNQVEISNI